MVCVFCTVSSSVRGVKTIISLESPLSLSAKHENCRPQIENKPIYEYVVLLSDVGLLVLLWAVSKDKMK